MTGPPGQADVRARIRLRVLLPEPLPAEVTVRPRVATVLLGCSMFLTGASGFIFECILSTVATFVLGNSIEQFSVTISLMMLMMGLAGYLQRHISDKGLIEKFLAVEIGLAILGGFAPIAVYAAYASMDAHFVLVQYFFVLSIGFLIGLEIPLVLRLNRSYVPRLKSNIASIFSTDYLGAFVGAVVWVYILLKYFPLPEISFFVAGINFFVALVTYGYFLLHNVTNRNSIPIVAIALTAIGLIYGYSQNRDWNRLLEQRFYDEPIVYSRTTDYQHIVLTAKIDPVDYRLYINGNLQFSSLDEHIYHEMLVHPAMELASSRDRVLILGGGDGLALREVLKYPESKEIILVDIDPGMIDFAMNNDVMNELNSGSLQDARVTVESALGVPVHSERRPIYEYAAGIGLATEETVEEAALVHVYTVDADRIVERLGGFYDVIVVDFPDPNSVELVKLYSREFYFKLNRVLAPGGIIAVQSTSPYHAKESFLCILRTIRSAGLEAIPYHDNVPSFGDWGWILASRLEQTGESVLDQIHGIKGFAVEESGAALAYLTPQRFSGSLSFGKNDLITDHDEINTLMAPVLLRFYLSESWKR